MGQTGDLTEIEITPEMVEAGERAIFQSPDWALIGGLVASDDLACLVYSAMEACRQSALDRSQL